MRLRSGGFSNHSITQTASRGDTFAIDPYGSFFVLSSGDGPNASGALASQKACESVIRYLIPKREELNTLAHDIKPDSRKNLVNILSSAVQQADQEVSRLADASPLYKGVVATCDLLYLVDSTVFIAHIGDSRIYLLRNDTGRQLTIDHNFVEFMRAQGQTNADVLYANYKNKLIHALGMPGNTDVDILQFDLRQGDRLIACTSGLHRCFQNATHLTQLCKSVTPQNAAEILANFALKHDPTSAVANICIEISDLNEHGRFIDTEGKITALEKIFFFQGLSYQEMLQVMPITFERTVAENTVIINEGEVGNELYILVDGSCDVSSAGIHIATLESGSCFGELALIDNQQRSATVKTITPCRLLSVRSNDFQKLTQSGNIAVKILWNIIHELSIRTRKSSETIREQGLKLKELT